MKQTKHKVNSPSSNPHDTLSADGRCAHKYSTPNNMTPDPPLYTNNTEVFIQKNMEPRIKVPIPNVLFTFLC